MNKIYFIHCYFNHFNTVIPFESLEMAKRAREHILNVLSEHNHFVPIEVVDDTQKAGKLVLKHIMDKLFSASWSAFHARYYSSSQKNLAVNQYINKKYPGWEALESLPTFEKYDYDEDDETKCSKCTSANVFEDCYRCHMCQATCNGCITCTGEDCKYYVK